MRGRTTATLYRVCRYDGKDALLEEWTDPLRAVVIDTALDYAVKVSKKFLHNTVVWECGEDGMVVRAFGTKYGIKWPKKIPCKDCSGTGKVYGGMMGAMVTCIICCGVGKLPEE